jgi:hypothetical protein
MRKSLVITVILFSFAAVASAKNLYIPVAGRVQGANNTFFRTDVRIFNPSRSTDIFVSVHFLPRGIDGSNIPGRLVSVPKRQMVVLNDIVGDFFGMTSGIGAIRLDSDTDSSYAFNADSRTYTDSANGTYGQFVPALDVSTAVKNSVVLHVTQNALYRANAGIMNPSRQTAEVTITLTGADGTKKAPQIKITIPPMSMIQDSLSSIFNAPVEVQDAFILAESSVPVFAWASIVDNSSGDQIFVPGVEDKEEVTPLP